MFAVVRIAGNQFKVEAKKNIIVPFLDKKEGEKIELKDILFFEKDGNISLDNSSKIVKGEIIKHIDGDKVIAFKMKRRKGFRKKKGHRTQYTQIKITDII